MSGGPLTPAESADARAKLRMLGTKFTARGRVSTLALGRAVSTRVSRFRWPANIDQAAAVVRQFLRDFDSITVGAGESKASSAATWTPLRREPWHVRIDPKRLTFHIPSIVGNQRVYRDGRVEDIASEDESRC